MAEEINSVKWARALKFILLMEGGYVNDPDDPGGETKYGISKRVYPSLDIKNLTERHAEKIYRNDYWDPCHCDELPEKLAITVFDCAVHQGVKRARRLLQMALRVTVDGYIGPVTIREAHKAGERAVLDLLVFRAQHYCDIAVNRERSRKYIKGWFRRLFKLADIVLEDEC